MLSATRRAGAAAWLCVALGMGCGAKAPTVSPSMGMQVGSGVLVATGTAGVSGGSAARGGAAGATTVTPSRGSSGSGGARIQSAPATQCSSGSAGEPTTYPQFELGFDPGVLAKVPRIVTAQLTLKVRRGHDALEISYVPRAAAVSGYRWTRVPEVPDSDCAL
jgi:hypothetical protein